jgi:hypothetical protein
VEAVVALVLALLLELESTVVVLVELEMAHNQFLSLMERLELQTLEAVAAAELEEATLVKEVVETVALE